MGTGEPGRSRGRKGAASVPIVAIPDCSEPGAAGAAGAVRSLCPAQGPPWSRPLPKPEGGEPHPPHPLLSCSEEDSSTLFPAQPRALQGCAGNDFPNDVSN